MDVGVIMGSDSDLPCMQAACDILEQFGVPYGQFVADAFHLPKPVQNSFFFWDDVRTHKLLILGGRFGFVL